MTLSYFFYYFIFTFLFVLFSLITLNICSYISLRKSPFTSVSKEVLRRRVNSLHPFQQYFIFIARIIFLIVSSLIFIFLLKQQSQPLLPFTLQIKHLYNKICSEFFYKKLQVFSLQYDDINIQFFCRRTEKFLTLT